MTLEAPSQTYNSILKGKILIYASHLKPTRYTGKLLIKGFGITVPVHCQLLCYFLLDLLIHRDQYFKVCQMLTDSSHICDK